MLKSIRFEYKLITYEHQVFLRAKGDRGCSVSVDVDFGCVSTVKLSLKPAMDFRRLAARARDARSESCTCSGGEAACEHVFICACAVATCSSFVERLRRPKASHVAHRPSSMKVLVRPTRPRRGHWACIVSNGRGGLTDVIRQTSDTRATVHARRTKNSRLFMNGRRNRIDTRMK